MIGPSKTAITTVEVTSGSRRRDLGCPGCSCSIPFVIAVRSLSKAVMDREGIATSILSIPAPRAYFGDVGLARQCNEFSADLIRAYPGRFGAYAVLPLPDVDAGAGRISSGVRIPVRLQVAEVPQERGGGPAGVYGGLAIRHHQGRRRSHDRRRRVQQGARVGCSMRS